MTPLRGARVQVLGSPDAGLPSYTEMADQYPTPAVMRELFAQYAPGGNVSNPLVCPLGADDLAGLPPALIFSSELDVLRDEAELYAARLLAARCEVPLLAAAPC